MTPRSTAARSWILFLALVQLLLPPAATLLDARLEREAALAGPGAVHVEAPGTKGCPPVHPADCALCRTSLVAFTAPAPAPTVLVVARVVARPGAAARSGVATAARTWDSPPRAPPASA